ncbi:MAG: glycosyltransferase, partial [Desulfocucumaceae bacterium]
NNSQPTSRRCIIVEPFLTGFAGHSFTVCSALKAALEKQGVEVVILASREARPEVLKSLGALPVFCSAFTGDDTEFPAFIPAAFKKLWLAYRHGTADLKKGFPPNKFRPGDIVFAYTMTTNWVLPLWYWARHSPHKGSPRIVWQFFFPLAAEGPGYWAKLLHRLFYRWLFAGVVRDFKAGNLLLCSDTEHRAAEYSRATGHNFGVLPMATEKNNPAPAAAKPRKICLSSLGPARRVKGIEAVCALAIGLQDLLRSGRIRFLIQANPQPEDDKKVVAAIESLRRANLPNLELINEPLAPPDYQAALAATDVMLLPYDPAVYGLSRTSGVFAESMAMGIPVVVTDNSWTARQCQRYKTGRIFAYGDPAGFEAAVREMVRKYPEYKKKALKAAEGWQGDHGAEALAAVITGRKNATTGNRADGNR